MIKFFDVSKLQMVVSSPTNARLREKSFKAFARYLTAIRILYTIANPI
jgi:hypothetical protein